MAKSSLLVRAQLLPLLVLGGYALVILALLTPFFQNHFVFLHSVNFPFNANFSNPERYGLAPSKARNVRLRTSDGVSLGAWHIVPDAFYSKAHPKVTSAPLTDADYEEALAAFPTVIYFHGNAGNRAAPFRMSSYNYITSRIHANVLAIDYRGFGDSKAPGVSPSEEGLVKDAWAAWDWVTSSKQNSNAKLGHAADSGGIGRDVILMGQSMGTGVASRLALELTEAGSPPQAVVLIAPYASLRSLVLDYQLGGIIPVMGPLKRMPGIDSLIDNYLITHFNSTSALHKLYFDTKVATPRPVPHLVLIHATKDDVIPFHHSERLFDALTTAELGSIARRGTSSQVDNLETHEIDGFGKIVHLDLQNTHTPQALSGATDGGEWDGHRERSATVTLIRTHWGGHNTGFSEGVADYVRQLLGWTDRT